MVLNEEIRRQIGQHFVFGFHGHKPSDNILKLINEYYLGNIIIFKRNIQSTKQLHGLIQSLQQAAKRAGHTKPLLIGIDQECGVVSAFSSPDAGTQFPGAMALGSTGDPDLANAVANAVGKELRQVGINWVYSPVADVNLEPFNPVIGVRSFGKEAQSVSEFVCAFSRGLESAGVASCAKHFPGHGDTHVDSHLMLPIIMKDLEELENNELAPFRAAIRSGISSIMSGHMALPPLLTTLGKDEDNYLPASLSSGVSSKLLREDMGFEGVLVTDCLEMDSISEEYGCGQGAVMALQAGADIVMICHQMERQVSAFEAVYSAVDKDQLSLKQLNHSNSRIQALKGKVTGEWSEISDSELLSDEILKLKQVNAQLSRSAYAKTIKWLSPTTAEGAQIPPHADVLVLTPVLQRMNAAVDDPEELLPTADGSQRNTSGPSFTAFATAIARRAPYSSHIVYSTQDIENNLDTLPENIEKTLSSVHTIIFVTRNACQPPSAWQLEVLRRVMLAIPETKVRIGTDDGEKSGVEESRKLIVLASCSPFDYDFLKRNERTRDLPCLCTFEHTEPALEEAAAILYGGSLQNTEK